MNEWILAFAASSGIAAIGFLVVAVVWLRKLRAALSCTMTEAASQQVRNAQRLNENLAELEKRLSMQEQNLQKIAGACLQLRQDVTSVTARVEHSERSLHGDSAEPTLH